MGKPLIKSRLLIAQKHLGDFIYDRDSLGRGYLKFSPKNEIADFNIGSSVPTTRPAPAKLTISVRVEVSYKFQDDFFSVKVISRGQKPSHQFHKVEKPPTTCLFFIRIKDWEALDDDDGMSNSPLFLPSPAGTKSVALVFSFLGANGKPIAPPEYEGGMRCFDLPEPEFNKFCIGIYPDPNNLIAENFTIWFPTPAL